MLGELRPLGAWLKARVKRALDDLERGVGAAIVLIAQQLEGVAVVGLVDRADRTGRPRGYPGLDDVRLCRHPGHSFHDPPRSAGTATNFSTSSLRGSTRGSHGPRAVSGGRFRLEVWDPSTTPRLTATTPSNTSGWGEAGSRSPRCPWACGTTSAPIVRSTRSAQFSVAPSISA